MLVVAVCWIRRVRLIFMTFNITLARVGKLSMDMLASTAVLKAEANKQVLGLPYTRIIYVESFARVTSLSLSAKLLRPFVDTFVVQWPQVANGGSEHASVEGKSWPDDGTAKVTSSRQKGRTGWRDWLRGRTVYKGWLV